MPIEYQVKLATGPVSGTIRPPGSKSITNRALVCAALAEGTSTLRGALDSEDTQLMLAALNQLGLEIEVRDSGETLIIAGRTGEWPVRKADLFLGNSGTSIRFLTAMLALGKGTYRLDGIDRMRERPIADLIDALRQWGGELHDENSTGCPPVQIVANGIEGGIAKIDGSMSSQFLSSLLMVLPYTKLGGTIEVDGILVSQPYVQMTLDVVKAFGGEIVTNSTLTEFTAKGKQCYSSCEYTIEPDASAASYFWAAAAITGGKVTVQGLSRNSLQGDVAFCECLQRMGCEIEWGENSIAVQGKPLSAIDVDMNAISDTVQTLAVVALFATGTTRIRNVAHIRHKETDRIAALATELRKLGAIVEEESDSLKITPAPLNPASIATYNDHRMAMSFALAGLKQPGVIIQNPGCTSKTYPNYFDDLERLMSSGRG